MCVSLFLNKINFKKRARERETMGPNSNPRIQIPPTPLGVQLWATLAHADSASSSERDCCEGEVRPHLGRIRTVSDTKQ